MMGRLETRKLLRHTVFDQLYVAILNGELEPGEVLHDSQLSAWLGASRTPIREALTRLATVGLVESEANKYTRVSPLDAQKMLDASIAYGWISAYSARKTFRGLDDGQITALRDANAALQATDPNDMCVLAHRMAALFDVIVSFCGNAFISSAHQDLSAIMRRFIASGHSPVEGHEFQEQIATIVDAADHRNPVEGGDLISQLSNGMQRRFQTGIALPA